MEPIQSFIDKFGFLGFRDIVLLTRILKVRQLKAGEIYVRAGDVHREFFGVVSGLVRNYIILPDGSEKTLRFTKEGMNGGVRNGLKNDVSSDEWIEAVEASILVCMDRESLEELAWKRPAIGRLYAEGLKEGLGEAFDHLLFHTLMSPEQRYEQFVIHYPDIHNRVQLKHLASYLGMTATSLSRIRSRVVKK